MSALLSLRGVTAHYGASQASSASTWISVPANS